MAESHDLTIFSPVWMSLVAEIAKPGLDNEWWDVLTRRHPRAAPADREHQSASHPRDDHCARPHYNAWQLPARSSARKERRSEPRWRVEYLATMVSGEGGPRYCVVTEMSPTNCTSNTPAGRWATERQMQ